MMNAIDLYRIGHWLHRHDAKVASKVAYYTTFLVFNSSIPASCVIGPRSRFAYGGIGVVIHADARIGEGVIIGQGVTLGGNFGSGAPVIGNNVYIAAGVRILGSVRVGDNVVIGANSVVLSDIPSDSICVGAPARVIRAIPKGGLNAVAGTLLEPGTRVPRDLATDFDQ